MGVEFKHQASLNHVVGLKQLLVCSVLNGSDGNQLKGTTVFKEELRYMMEIGEACIKLMKQVPYGNFELSDMKVFLYSFRVFPN